MNVPPKVSTAQLRTGGGQVTFIQQQGAAGQDDLGLANSFGGNEKTFVYVHRPSSSVSKQEDIAPDGVHEAESVSSCIQHKLASLCDFGTQRARILNKAVAIFP